MINLNQCLDEAAISDYLAGRTSPHLTVELEAHLLACPSCEARLARHRPQTNSIVGILKGIPTDRQASAPPQLAELPEPSAIARFIREYKLIERLGSGGQGNVYLALHTRLDKHVAIKLLRPDRVHDPQAIARFQREMRAAGKLEHPNIVRADNAGEERGLHFLVMEYVDGIDLAALLRVHGPLFVPDAAELIRQAALGLHYAHQHDLVHRDVKPSNLMLSRQGLVKVLDLGLAQLNVSLDSDLTQQNQMLGTLRYVAPEQLALGAVVDCSSDIYSLGITLYELLVGPDVLRQSAAPALAADIRETRADVPPQIWSLLRAMLAHDRAARPPSMQHVVDALAQWSHSADMASLSGLSTSRSVWPRKGPPPLPSRSQSEVTTEVEPPPPPVTQPIVPAVTTVLEFVPAPPLPPPRTAPIPQRLLIASVILLALGVGFTASSYWWPPPPKVVPPPPPSPMVYGNAGEDAVIQQAIDMGLIQLKSVEQDHSQTFKLTAEQTSVPPGMYELLCLAPGIEIEPQTVLAEEGASLEITPHRIRLPLHELLTPRIPAEQGAYLWLDGQLWHPGLDSEITFTVRLETFHTHTIDAVEHRWIKVEIGQDEYKETAYLLIDSQQWDKFRQLEIRLGWILAQSGSIKDRLQEAFPGTQQDQIAVPFDGSIDNVQLTAERHGLPLPKHRITVHHALTTIFGAREIQVAPKEFRDLRNDLQSLGERRETLIRPSVAFGNYGGLAIGGYQGETRLYQMVRNDQEVPFSFLEIEVDIPRQFRARLSYHQSSRIDPETLLPTNGATLVAAAEARASLFQTLKPTPNYYDRAAFPAGEASSYYAGAIQIGNLPKFGFRIYLYARGQEMFEERVCRRLEIEVESLLPNRATPWVESAVLYVDQEKLGDGEFEIVAAWLMLDSETFALDAATDFDNFARDLVKLGRERASLKLGVHDALVLMFDARVQSSSEIGKLRQHLREILTLQGIEKLGRKEDALLYDNRTAVAMVYELPAPEPSAPPLFRLKRVSSLPFAFANVVISLPEKFEFNAAIRGEDWEGLPALEAAALQLAAAKSKEALGKLDRTNWRVFTHLNAGRKEFLWAEFGGVHNGVAHVRAASGEYFRLPLLELSADDRAFIREGRVWTRISGETENHASIDSADRNGIRFKDETTGRAMTMQGKSLFSAADQKWIDYFYKALPR